MQKAFFLKKKGKNFFWRGGNEKSGSEMIKKNFQRAGKPRQMGRVEKRCINDKMAEKGEVG